jgi:glycosyltransferase involved in cell wall biosynthesis
MTAAPAQRLRVLMVTPWGPWREASGDTLILQHHLRLLSARHEITLLVNEAAPAGYAFPGVDIAAGPDPRSAAADYVVRRLRAIATGEPAHVYWTQRRALIGRFEARVASGDVDVVHLFGWGTASLVTRARGLPTVHMPVDHWASGNVNRAQQLLRRIADVGEERAIDRHERKYYAMIDAVVFVAELDAERMRARSPDAHVVVVPNGVEPGPAPAAPIDEPVLAFHGAFETRANIDAAQVLVNEVFPLVLREVPNARVLLIGRDPGPEVQALAGPAVTVTGAVPDVRTELARAAVYVAPMTSGSGMKNKVLEAMAAGLPVVAMPLGLSGIGAGGGVSRAESPADVAMEVVRLLRDARARHEAGRAARQRAEQEFSWERSAAQVERLWFDAVQTKRRAAVSGGPSTVTD